MKKKITAIVLVLAFIIVILGVVLLYNNLSAKQTEANNSNSKSEVSVVESDAEIDDTTSADYVLAPDVTFTDIDGNEVMLSDFKGKPVVMNFWASWCPPCKSEMPDFDKVYGELGEEIEFLMINMTDGSRETEKNAKAFISDNAYSFPVYFDLSGEVSQTYAVYSIPSTYFIDKDGYVITYAKGMIDEPTLLKGIDMIK